MLLECGLTSKARGVVFLVALGMTTVLTAIMWDDLIAPLYGFAFAPLYVCLAIGFADIVDRPPRSFAFNNDEYMPRDYSRCSIITRIFTFCTWLVILVLLPLQLSDIKTVDATAIAGVFAFWLLFVVAAQMRPKNPHLRPLTLASIVEYFSDVSVGVPVQHSILGREVETNIELPDAPPNLEDDAFDQKFGTQRHISVNDSVRGSPLNVQDDALLNSDDEIEDIRVDSHTPADAVVVTVPRRATDMDGIDFDPDDARELARDVLG